MILPCLRYGYFRRLPSARAIPAGRQALILHRALTTACTEALDWPVPAAIANTIFNIAQLHHKHIVMLNAVKNL